MIVCEVDFEVGSAKQISNVTLIYVFTAQFPLSFGKRSVTHVSPSPSLEVRSTGVKPASFSSSCRICHWKKETGGARDPLGPNPCCGLKFCKGDMYGLSVTWDSWQLG